MPAHGATEGPLPGVLVLLVARRGEGPLELDTRRRIYLAINRYPGLALARIGEEAGLDEDLVRYHVRVLERAALVRSEADGPRRRVYPMARTAVGSVSALDQRERRVLGLLRKPAVLRVVVALLEQDQLSAGELADRCGISPSTASHHIKRLEAEGVVGVKREGRQRLVGLADRGLVMRLLAEHPPPKDLVQDFIETWDDLGF